MIYWNINDKMLMTLLKQTVKRSPPPLSNVVNYTRMKIKHFYCIEWKITFFDWIVNEKKKETFSFLLDYLYNKNDYFIRNCIMATRADLRFLYEAKNCNKSFWIKFILDTNEFYMYIYMVFICSCNRIQRKCNATNLNEFCDCI